VILSLSNLSVSRISEKICSKIVGFKKTDQKYDKLFEVTQNGSVLRISKKICSKL
jgi:hypothetical protein